MSDPPSEYTRSDLERLEYKTLQKVAKSLEIKSNQGKNKIIAQILGEEAAVYVRHKSSADKSLSKASTSDIKPLQSTSLRPADSATKPSSKLASPAASLEHSVSYGTSEEPAPAETHIARSSSSQSPSEPDSRPTETTESSDSALLKVNADVEQSQALTPEQPANPSSSNSIVLEETSGSSDEVSPETQALSQTNLPSTPALDAEKAALEALRTLEEYTRALHQRALQAQEANERHYAMQLALEDWITATEEQQQTMKTGIKSMKDLVAAHPGGSRQTRRRSDDDDDSADLDSHKKIRIAAI